MSVRQAVVFFCTASILLLLQVKIDQVNQQYLHEQKLRTLHTVVGPQGQRQLPQGNLLTQDLATSIKHLKIVIKDFLESMKIFVYGKEGFMLSDQRILKELGEGSREQNYSGEQQILTTLKSEPSRLPTNYSIFSGFYEGKWQLPFLVANSSSISPLFTHVEGGTKLDIDFFEGDSEKKEGSQLLSSGFLFIFDGKFRDREIQLQFDIHDDQHLSTNDNYGMFHVPNVSAVMIERSGLSISLPRECQVDMSVESNLKAARAILDEFKKNQAEEQIDLDEIDLFLNFSLSKVKGANNSCFEEEFELNFSMKSVVDLIEKISDYSFFVTTICMIFVYQILGVIKRTTDNNYIAQAISIPSLSFSIIWNFISFTLHFEIAVSKTYYNYLSLPAFWYFMISFVFQFRLLLDCWKVQNMNFLLQNQQSLRRKLTAFYIRFYFFLLIFYIFHLFIIYNTLLLLLFNATIWVPQIYRNYAKKQRIQPSTSYQVILTLNHCVFIAYMYGCPYNFMDKQPNYLLLTLYLTFLTLQLVTMYLQKKIGPRFFIPRKYRRDPNSYNYYFKFPKETDPERADIQEDEDCVICMNPLRFEVDSRGNNSIQTSVALDQQDPSRQRRAKYYMRTPCAHKFHVMCLKKWMEIKLECPTCRQNIPPIDDDY